MSEAHLTRPDRPDRPDEHPERHEHSDVPTRPLVIFFVSFVIIAILVHVVLWWVFNVFENREAHLDKNRERSLVDIVDRIPPQPRLQGVPGLNPPPREELARMRRENAGQMTAYGKSGEEGFARIPVNRAMDLIVERQLLKSSSTRPTTRSAQHVH